MNTSSKFVVATHVMAAIAAHHLAMRKPLPVSSDEIACSVNTNAVVIRRILAQLRQAGLVRSQSGPGGGSMLTRNPELITLRHIHDAVEEGQLFHLHYTAPNDCCPVGDNIQGALSSILIDAENAVKQVLSSQTLAQVATDIMQRSGITDKLAQGHTPESLKKQFSYTQGTLIEKQSV